MQRFLQELRNDLGSYVPLVVWVSLTVVVTLAGPYGSNAYLTFPQRLLYWGCVVGVSILVGVSVRAFTRSVLGVTTLIGSTLLIAIIITAIMLIPIHVSARKVFGEDNEAIPALPELAALIMSVSLAVGVFRAARTYAYGADQTGALPVASPPEMMVEDVVQPRLIARLQDGATGDLVSISGRDHYVDVVTTSGQSRVLLRFSDAIAEAEPIEGFRIHRSHWVALSAIVRVEREGGKLWVALVDGARLPVSRTYRDELEMRGLLEAELTPVV